MDVEEIVLRYPALDGVQFDYIRYPDMHPHYGYTKSNIKRFKKATGLKSIEEDSQVWKDWKRKQVSELLEGLANKARALNPRIQVSVTGCIPYSRALYEAYQDWPSWISGGLVDYVTIMSYSPDPEEFKNSILVVKEKVPDFFKVKIGVGAYKLLNSPEIFEQELAVCREMKAATAVFHYGSLLENPKLKEFLNNEH